MKRIAYYLLLSCLVLLGSCKQDIDFPYAGKDRIQFQHYTTDWNGNRHYIDSITFSFGLVPAEELMDTLKLPVEYLGAGSDQERTYYVSVVADSTTAEEGVHYLPFERVQKFRPNELTDTLCIVILRESLPNDYTTGENLRLELQMEACDDFDLGLRGGIQKKIMLNNYMSEPTWWSGALNGYFGFFHPKKWQFLIEKLDDKLATYGEIPYTINSAETHSYVSSLSLYLNNTVVIDDKTGMRVTMNGLEPIE